MVTLGGHRGYVIAIEAVQQQQQQQLVSLHFGVGGASETRWIKLAEQGRRKT